MTSGLHSVLIVCCVCLCHVTSRPAFSVPRHFHIPETVAGSLAADSITRSGGRETMARSGGRETMERSGGRETMVWSDGVDTVKRSRGVDAWAICPPGMADVHCFYAYLRVYARLRKAAQESDRVALRNIGKRTGPSASQRAKRRLSSRELCPDNTPPSSCYQTAKSVYRRVRLSLGNRFKLTEGQA